MKNSVWGTFAALALLARPCIAEEPLPIEPLAVPGAEQGLAPGGDYGPYPEPDSGYVTDLAGLLNQDEQEQIERWLWQVEAKTGVEIAVVLIRSMSDYPDSANGSIEAFATELFNRYGIGNQPKNDGVLLLVAKNDRVARIELGAGYGRSRDADAVQIMEGRIIPQFKKERYAEGVTEGVKGIMKEFAGVRIGVNWTLIVLLAAIPVVAVIAYSLFRSGKRGWGWVCVGLVVILVLAAARTVHAIVSSLPEGSSDSWSSGGFGGGFGGGSSGGGGATGSW